MASGQEMKRKTLEVYSKDEGMTEDGLTVIKANWPLDDMDEVELEECM